VFIGAVVISQSVGWSRPELLYYLAIYIIYILAHSAFVMYSPHAIDCWQAVCYLFPWIGGKKRENYWQRKALEAELPPRSFRWGWMFDSWIVGLLSIM